jgi:ATP-dependent RNA helicase HelY
MAVNLVDRLGRRAARDLLEQSFAQYQANAAVVGLARQVARNSEAIASHASAMQCHLGDTASYLALLTELAAAEKEIARAGASRRRDATARDLAELRRGDVIEVPTGRRAGLAVVLDPGVAADGSARPLVVTAGSWAGRLTVADFHGPVPALGRLRLGKYTDHRTPKVRRDVASALASSGIRPTGRGARREPVEEIDLTVLRKAIRAHPVHGCADRDEHVQWARRWRRLTIENDALAAKVASATGSLGKALDEIIDLLEERGYLRGDRLTGDGKMLARIWSESDLVVAECLRRGTWDGLDQADLAAVVSSLVFESRRESLGTARTPSGSAAQALLATTRVWAEIAARERALGLTPTRDPDAGFAAAVASWCRGSTLAEALTVAVAGGTELSAGDFVRWCRQVIDLLDQVGGVAQGAVGLSARSAVGALRRGVVAMGSV